MLIELVKVAKFPLSPWLAQIRTPFGGTAVRWGGDQAAEPGEYHVEWTVGEDITWGRNARPAADFGQAPGVPFRPIGASRDGSAPRGQAEALMDAHCERIAGCLYP